MKSKITCLLIIGKEIDEGLPQPFFFYHITKVRGKVSGAGSGKERGGLIINQREGGKEEMQPASIWLASICNQN